MTTKLSQFSSCEVSDALIKLGHLNGGHAPDIHLLSLTSTSICAPAYTVKMVLASDTVAPKLSAHFVDTIPAGSIVVIDAPPEAKNAVWGGLMTAGALARSAVGVVISGRCRDLGEHRAQGFPVFARGYSTVGQSPFTRPSAVNIPICINPQGDLGQDGFPALTIRPGDWILADEDGVVCVPDELVGDVVKLAEKGREVDRLCLEDIQAGASVQETFKLRRGK